MLQRSASLLPEREAAVEEATATATATATGRVKPPWVRVGLLQAKEGHGISTNDSPLEVLVLRRRRNTGGSAGGAGMPARVRLADLPGVGETQKLLRLIGVELRGGGEQRSE